MCGLVQTVTGSPSVCSSLHPYTFQRSGALWASDQKKGFLSVFPACFTTTVQLCGNKAIEQRGGKSPQRLPFPNTHSLGTARALCLGSSERRPFFRSSSSCTTTQLLELILGVWLREKREKMGNLSPCGPFLHSPPSGVDSPVSSGVCFVFCPEDLVVVSRRRASFLLARGRTPTFSSMI